MLKISCPLFVLFLLPALGGWCCAVLFVAALNFLDQGGGPGWGVLLNASIVLFLIACVYGVKAPIDVGHARSLRGDHQARSMVFAAITGNLLLLLIALIAAGVMGLIVTS